MGAPHDGDFDSVSCPDTDNFIMTSQINRTSIIKNPLNVWRFSSCSINAFKSVILKNGNSAVSDQGSCLTNVPGSNGLNVYVDDKQPGQYLTADDQCKQMYGSTASFCQVINHLRIFWIFNKLPEMKNRSVYWRSHCFIIKKVI